MANEKSKTKTSTLGIEDISVLLNTLEEHDVTEFRLEREGEKLWLKRGTPQVVTQVSSVVQSQAGSEMVSRQSIDTQNASSHGSTAESGLKLVGSGTSVLTAANSNIKEVRSPMVGTFYRRPAVDAECYVSIGDSIKKGDVLCIIEAMKLMNEIESEVSGKVVEICLEDGQMVEYGEVLFKVDIS